VLSLILRVGLLTAVLVQVGSSFSGGRAVAQTEEERLGRSLYEASCSSCHGLDARGTDLAPTLEGVGAASLDFQMSTGRMPMGDPNRQAHRGEPRFTPEEIEAIIAYVLSIVPGGPEIPNVDVARGDLSYGMQLYITNCAGCHGAGAAGASVGGGQIAPSLMPSTATHIAQAIRVGPGLMPRWDEEGLSERDVDSIAAYLLWMRENADQGGFPFGRVGAVVEGFIAGVIGIGIILLVVRLTGAKT
jgi:ubiquinol-cytochrome c reductase cytochrome c subunit